MKRFLLRHKLQFIVVVLLACLSSIFLVLESFFIKSLTDSTMSKDFNLLKINIIIYLGYILVQALITYLYRKSKSFYIKNSMTFVKNEIFQKLISKSAMNFKSENSAKKISLLTNDIKLLEDDCFNNIFVLIIQLFSFITGFICLFILSPEITIAVLVVISFVVFIPKLFTKKLITLRGEYSNLLEGFTLKIKDVFSGIDVIKSFKLEGKITKDYENINNKVEASKYKFSLLNGKVQFLSQILLSLVFVVLFSLGAYLIFVDKITYGTIIACIQLLGSISNPVYNSIEYINRAKSLKNVTSKITKLYENEENNDLNSNSLIHKESLEELINVSNLNFGYDKSKLVLKDINLSLEKNKKYAIVGGSGSGKSTLSKILTKDIINYSGDVYFDNSSLKDISYDSLYSLISIIHQNVFLFDTTIKENITLYNDYNEEQISYAINNYGLSKTLENLNKGLETPVGENGNNLSGGEKQRISIASSSLDNNTAYDVENLILSMENTTCVIITHRLNESLLKKYDKIFVLKEGNLVESGSFKSLMENKKYFYNLFNVEN